MAASQRQTHRKPSWLRVISSWLLCAGAGAGAVAVCAGAIGLDGERGVGVAVAVPMTREDPKGAVFDTNTY